ncbi:phosphomannomutase/phosphoglucomutase [Desulfovibrio sp.]
MIALNPGVFRAYDIRGLVDRDLDPDFAEDLGRACGTLFVRRGLTRAVAGHDCRATSPEYLDRLCLGLASAGVDVITLGLVSTPVLYYAVKHFGLEAGVMVTASHNPPEYNGFKIWCGASTLHGEGVAALRDLMAARDFIRAERPGLVSRHDVIPSYLDELSSQLRVSRPIKVVVDGGNGAAGEITAELLERVGCEVIRLFCEPDGGFPNHHPDPVVEQNVRQLSDLVRESGADLGVGLDGDGDRIGAVDETGRLMFGDQVLALYARGLLRRRPGQIVIGDVKCSHLLFRDIEEHGGVPVMAATGHSLMKAKLIETGAALAGEMSGHMFFSDRFFGFDDASYAALRLVEVLDENPGTPLSRLLGWPRTANTPELRVDCPEEIKFQVVDKALAHFRDLAERNGWRLDDTDGVRLTLPRAWGLVRASNTQAALVLRFEGEDEQALAEIRHLMEPPISGFAAGFAGS